MAAIALSQRLVAAGVVDVDGEFGVTGGSGPGGAELARELVACLGGWVAGRVVGGCHDAELAVLARGRGLVSVFFERDRKEGGGDLHVTECVSPGVS